MFTTGAPTTYCPKCRAHRTNDAEECVRCGIIFAKYKLLTAKARLLPSKQAFTQSEWFLTVKQWLVDSDTTTESLTFYGRAVMFVAMVWWGWAFITTPLETNYTGESFLHLINLPFHEAGHVIFIPFGRFMTILGELLAKFSCRSCVSVHSL